MSCKQYRSLFLPSLYPTPISAHPCPCPSPISDPARDFAFVAGDKDSCMLKCHVFRCDVPAKAIASALQGLCAQVRAKSGAGNVGVELV